MATDNVEELRQWCEKSRKLLKTTTLKIESGATTHLREELKRVMNLLTQIEGDRRYIVLFKDCMSECNRLGTALEEAGKNYKNASEKERNAQQEKFTRDFGVVERKIQKALTEAQEQREQARRLSEARFAYEREYTKALQAVELLKILPKANAGVVEKKLQTIHDQASQNNVDAYNIQKRALEQLQVEIKKAQDEAERFRQLELKQWESRPAAQAALDNAQQGLAELEKLVGIEATLEKYRNVVQAAEKLAAADNWTQVLEKLKELKALPNAKKCREDSESKEKSLSSVPAYGQGQEQLNKLKTLRPADVVATLEKEFVAKVNQLFPASGVSDPSAIPELGRVVRELQEKVNTAQTLRNELDQQSLTLTNLMEETRSLISAMAVIPLQSQFENFAALLAAKQLDTAKGVGDKLQQALNQDLPARRQTKQTWDAKKSEAVEMSKTLVQLLSSACAGVSSKAGVVNGLVAPAFVQVLEQDHDWARLVADLERARPQVEELKRMHEGHLGLEDARLQGTREINERHETLKPLINKLATAVANAVRKGGGEIFDSTKTFQAEIDDAKATWVKAGKSATDAPTLTAAKEACLRALDVVKEDLVAAADPQGIARLLEIHAQEQMQPTFDRQWQVYEGLAEQLRALDAGSAGQIDAEAKKINARAAANYKKGSEDLQLLLVRLRSAVTLATGIRDREHQALTQLAQETLNEINRVKKASKHAKDFAEAFAALTTEHAELVQLGTSNNLEAIKEATKGLTALKERASKFAPENNTGEGLSLDKVMLMLVASEKLLKSLTETLKANDPRSLLRLTERLVALKTEVLAADPGDGMVKVSEFTGALTEAETGAKKVIETREEYGRLEPLVTTALQTFAERGAAPEYAKALQARFKEAHGLAKDPSKLFEALTKLKAIDSEVRAASRDLSVAVQKEKEERGAQHQKQADEREYKASVKIFEDRHAKAARQAVKDQGGDKALILEIERMAGVARQSAKDGDHAKALHQIRLCIERAQQIAADPYGPAIGSRNNLPKDEQVYREALTAFNQSLDTVRDVTLKAAPDIHASVADKLRSLIEGLKTKFDPNAFASPLRQLSQDGISDADRRGFREVALARVRQVRSTLEGNPQVVLLLKNPAAKSEFSLGYRRVQSALNRLEANISRSCR